MIGIIGAMEEEIVLLRDTMKIYETKEIGNSLFYIGKFLGKEVVLLQSGIGKVSSAVSTTLLFTHFDIEFVINFGSAGGIKKGSRIGDVVVSDRVCYHDVDVTGFNHPYGKVPKMPLFFESSKDLGETLLLVLKENHIPHHVGLIASGDSFITDKARILEAEKLLDAEILAVEMEAASIAQVCYIYQKPFIIIRSLSDIVGNDKQKMDFSEYLQLAAKNSTKIVTRLLAKL